MLRLLDTEEAQDSLLFLLLFANNDIHVPSKFTSQVQDPPDVNEII
jgi:hypothetical protein